MECGGQRGACPCFSLHGWSLCVSHLVSPSQGNGQISRRKAEMALSAGVWLRPVDLASTLEVQQNLFYEPQRGSRLPLLCHYSLPSPCFHSLLNFYIFAHVSTSGYGLLPMSNCGSCSLSVISYSPSL